jgi:hypothetical protein
MVLVPSRSSGSVDELRLSRRPADQQDVPVSCPRSPGHAWRAGVCAPTDGALSVMHALGLASLIG